MIKLVQAQEPNLIPNQHINGGILSDLRNTKQTQTKFSETANQPISNRSENNEPGLGSQHSKNDSKKNFSDLEVINGMMSGSKVNFGVKVKSDYINSQLSQIDNNHVKHGSHISHEINARSGFYENGTFAPRLPKDSFYRASSKNSTTLSW